MVQLISLSDGCDDYHRDEPNEDVAGCSHSAVALGCSPSRTQMSSVLRSSRVPYEATVLNCLERAVLLWNSREVTDVSAELVLMEHPLILARRPDRDVELLDAARTVGVRRTCVGASCSKLRI